MQKNDQSYTQVHLTKRITGSITTKHMVAWIPSKFARAGKLVQTKEKSGWVNGWVIKKVFGESSRHCRELEESQRRQIEYRLP